MPRNEGFVASHEPLRHHASLNIRRGFTSGPLSFLNPTRAHYRDLSSRRDSQTARPSTTVLLLIQRRLPRRTRMKTTHRAMSSSGGLETTEKAGMNSSCGPLMPLMPASLPRSPRRPFAQQARASVGCLPNTHTGISRTWSL